ncbi:GlxA family transcriptional regulator [Falsiroseomonas selenitidurans]|uniref:Helix-turn-helix domain-containing protein n=1 Tax=Falsiroseomonas selenitidurans TaxID=2716335 RepID=A0ABX1E6H2_9PROT|nr:helix-turn-helix domain-containing protein [Falsiroseomonas selenitidurans]NKC31117.1 helix-turn-helix domain-containing protein [Falsiroseomonas selenitidurans]
MIAPYAPARLSVCLVAMPEISTGVLNGFYEVFSFVGSGWEMMTGWPSGPRRFVPRIVAQDAVTFRNVVGLPITPDISFAQAKRADIVIVGDLAIGRHQDTRGLWPDAVAWLRRQHAQGALICSVCTGSLVLAEAGLLDGEDATCHWAAADQIRSRYPAVRLHPERVLVATGAGHRLVTSGASASWTDLALYLVARFCGEEEARRTAKLFLFGDRSDGQLPFAARVRPPQHDDAAIAAAQDWIAQNYACAHPVAGMAQVAGLASRTFMRRFKAATGYLPLDYVQSLRIEEAKQMLETTDTPIDSIADEVGYQEPAAFRRIFKRATGIAPNHYRQRFRRVAVA